MEWTGNAEADQLVAGDPTALLIGFCLDQQIPVEWAFMGPLLIRQRLGSIEAATIAGTNPERLEAIFRTPPALHRYPRSMARRVQALCQVIADAYDGDASRIWTEARDAHDLQRRFQALPGFGAAKARIMVAVVAKHLGVKPAGWESVVPEHPTLADVHTVAEREAYQAQKRAHKAELRAAAATGSETTGKRDRR